MALPSCLNPPSSPTRSWWATLGGWFTPVWFWGRGNWITYLRASDYCVVFFLGILRIVCAPNRFATVADRYHITVKYDKTRALLLLMVRSTLIFFCRLFRPMKRRIFWNSAISEVQLMSKIRRRLRTCAADTIARLKSVSSCTFCLCVVVYVSHSTWH